MHLDDWHYCFIYGTTNPIESFSDIIKSQYSHYFEMNGRLIPHLFVQFFDGITGKKWFNLFNTISLILFLHQLNITITQEKQKYYKITTITIILLFIFLPGFKFSFLWMSGACNYLWIANFTLSFNILLQRYDYNKVLLPIYFIYGIICGWTHEGIVIGLGCGYFLYYIINRNKLNYYRITLLIGLYIGILFLILSPGSINRAIGGMEATNIYDIIYSYIYSLYRMNNIRLFPILIIVIILLKSKINYKIFFKENIQWFIAIFILFIFIIFTKHTSGHSRFGIEFYSIILLLILYNKFTSQEHNKAIDYLNLTFILFSFFFIIPDLHSNYKIYEKEKALIINSKDNLIPTNNINSYFDKYIISYINKKESDFYNIFISDNWENTLIAKYFKKEKIFFLPERIVNDISKNPSKYKTFHTEQDYPLYIKQIENKEYEKLTEGGTIKYKLQEVSPSAIPLYYRPFIRYLGRYSLTEVETTKYTIIEINSIPYLFIGKNSMIDNRVYDIIIN